MRAVLGLEMGVAGHGQGHARDICVCSMHSTSVLTYHGNMVHRDSLVQRPADSRTTLSYGDVQGEVVPLYPEPVVEHRDVGVQVQACPTRSARLPALGATTAGGKHPNRAVCWMSAPNHSTMRRSWSVGCRCLGRQILLVPHNLGSPLQR